MSTKTLEAVLSAQETVSEALEDIQDELDKTAKKAGATAVAFQGLSASAAELDDELSEVNKQSADISDSTAEVADSVDDVAEDLGKVNHKLDEFTEKTEKSAKNLRELRGVNNTMSRSLRRTMSTDQEDYLSGLLDDDSIKRLARMKNEVRDLGDSMERLNEADMDFMLPDRGKSDKDTFLGGRNIGGAIQKMDELEESVDKISKANMHLNKVASQTDESISGEGRAFAKAMMSAEGLEEAKEAVRGANSALAASAGVTAGAIAEEQNEFLQAMASGESVSDTIDQLAAGEGKLAAVAQAANRVLSEQQQEQYKNAASALIAAEGEDEFSDEIKDVAASAALAENRLEEMREETRGLGRDSLAASVNVGPFNLALRNMAVQLPALITLLGAVTSSLGGVTAAATSAAVAFGGIFAAGALQMGQQAARETEEAENAMEGMQLVMERFRKVFINAMQPMMNTRSIEMFQRFMYGLADTVNLLSQSIASIQGKLSAFQSDIGATWFNNFGELAKQTEKIIIAFMPWLDRLFTWIMRKLPQAFAFLRKEGLRVMPVLAEFSNTVAETFAVFSQFGVTLFKGLLPAFGAFLKILTDAIQVFNSLPDALTVTGIKLLAFAFIIKRSVEFGKDLKETLGNLLDYSKELGSNFKDLASDISDAGNEMEETTEALKEFEEARKKATGGEDENDESGVFGTIATALITLLPKLSIFRSLMASIGGYIGGALSGAISVSVGSLAALAAVVVWVAGVIWLLWDAISVGIERFNEITGMAGGLSDTWSALAGVGDFVVDVFSGLWDILSAVGQTILNIVSIGVIKHFELFAAVVDFLLNDLGPMNEIVAMLGEGMHNLGQEVNGLQDWMRGLGKAMTDGLSQAATALEDFVNKHFIKNVNRMIEAYNRLLELPGFKTAVSTSLGIPKEGMNKVSKLDEIDFRSRDFGPQELASRQEANVSEKPNQTVVNGDYKPTNNNYDMSGSEFNMKPEEKARIKGLINEAINKANKKRRVKDGF